MKKFFTLLLAGAAILSTGCKDDDPVPVYSITTSNDGHGKAEASTGEIVVTESIQGATITITATANEDYKFTKWTVVSGGAELSSTTTNPATFTMPGADVEVKAEFEAIQRTVTMSNDTNGTAVADPADAAKGEKVTITATPNDGFLFKEWVVVSGGVTLSKIDVSPAEFTMPANEVEIKAVFTAIERAVNMTNDGKGTATANPAVAAKDATVSITATPNNGFVFKKWTVVSGGVTLSSTTTSPATFTMPATEVTIKAEFEAIQYTVNATGVDNGSASANPANAAQGVEVSLTATPDDGFEFKQWVVVSGGVTLSSATANPATFTMPGNDVTVKAEFEAIPTVIRYKVGDYYPDPNVVYEGGNVVDGEAATGVVFWLDTTDADYNAADKSGTKGKVVSLTEKDKIFWSDRNTATAITTGATNTDNGAVNMTTIKNIADWETKFPAFKWVADQGDGWYIPARHELLYLYCAFNGQEYKTSDIYSEGVNEAAREAFDAKLTGAGGKKINSAKPGTAYWSSTEYDLKNVYTIVIGEMKTNYIEKYWNKQGWDQGSIVRPIRAF